MIVIFIFSLPPCPYMLWGPPSLMGTGDSYPRGKVEGCNTDYSPPSSAKVNNVCSNTSTPPPNMSSVWCLIKLWICLHGVVLSYAQEQHYLLTLC
jgi:hypothetical protein